MSKLYTAWQVSVHEQRLTMQQIPRLASGAVNSVVLAFTGLDNGNWAGLTYTAVFWRNEKEVHHVLTRETESGETKVWAAVVPAEVMAEEGAFWLGLMGTGDGFTITTEAIRLNVFQGAITTPTADPAEPTPDVYAQLLQGYAATNARVSELIAMRGGSGETVIEMSGDDYIRNGLIKVNGASAVISFEIDELGLDAYGEHSTDGCIQPAQAPLFPEGLDSIPIYCDSASFDVSIKKGAEGWSYIKIINKDSDIAHAYGTKCWGFFPLASVTVHELVDARVDREGKVWPTVGDHLRAITSTGMYYKYDFNGDGVVNEDDHTHLLYHVNSIHKNPNPYPLSWWSVPDVDGDGDVDLDDAIALLHLVQEGDPAAFELLPKEESILDGELNGTSVRPVQNKAIGQGVANALKGTASGAVIALTDVSPLDHEIGVKLSVKNLLDLTSLIGKSVTENGGTLSCGTDGGITGSGTLTGYIGFDAFRLYLPKGKYILSSSGDYNNFGCYFVFRDENAASLAEGSVSKSGGAFTFDTAGYPALSYVDVTIKRNNNTALSGTAYFQLEAGTTATAYTPHVADVSTATLKKYGKNLVDISQMLNECLVDNGDGTFTYTKKAPYDSAMFPLKLKAGTKITSKAEIISSQNNTENSLCYRVTYADGGIKGYYLSDSKVTLEKDIVGLVIYSYEANASYVFKEWQLEIGTEASAYEPYKEPETYQVNPDGSPASGVTSLAPTTTLLTDTAGVTIDATYNRDTNKVIERLVSAIISLGGNV